LAELERNAAFNEQYCHHQLATQGEHGIAITQRPECAAFAFPPMWPRALKPAKEFLEYIQQSAGRDVASFCITAYWSQGMPLIASHP
jgi:hypothetical protein